MLLHQEAGGVYSINGPTTRHKAALVVGELDDFTDSSIEDSLEDLHAVRKKRIGRLKQLAGLPFVFQIGIVVLLCQHSGTFFSFTTWLKNSANHSAGYQSFDFQTPAARSSGPVALPGFTFFRVASVSAGDLVNREQKPQKGWPDKEIPKWKFPQSDRAIASAPFCGLSEDGRSHH
ncbi:unnamed protein product [Heligmosomoides polygyrus]|uniref:Transposase n=1 Tax=Heligmosomoides polygyrus TaxID=6339 RepID=A0A183G9L3_HELPZ|nr:unnamed protein product [Heligmosomoides polygyrus]